MIIYPFGVYIGLKSFEPKYIGILLLIILLLRIITSRQQIYNFDPKQFLPVFFAIALSASLVLIFNKGIFLLLHPFFINISLLALFSYTLWRPPSIIERIARISKPDLAGPAITYTENVTKVWCLFFIANGMISLWTVFFSDIEIWTIYNGFISYMLIGLVFGIEYTIRQYKIRQYEK